MQDANLLASTPLHVEPECLVDATMFYLHDREIVKLLRCRLPWYPVKIIRYFFSVVFHNLSSPTL